MQNESEERKRNRILNSEGSGSPAAKDVKLISKNNWVTDVNFWDNLCGTSADVMQYVFQFQTIIC